MLDYTSTDLQKALSQTSQAIDETIDDILPTATGGRQGERRLAEAMRYAALAQGKRIRPFLVMVSSGMFGVAESRALKVAAAIEMIHAYSLVHDDLPALDDDDTRRGKPSCHVEFDEATAILAGDALLTIAFEVLSHENTHADHAVRTELIAHVARCCGVRGMIGGQMMDLLSESQEMHIEEITRLQRMKTGELFAVSCEAGAILGKASRSMRNALRGYAYDIGLAFQIVDDLLDAESDEKSGRLDKSSGKGTLVSSMGVERARRQSRLLTDQAISHLEVFGKRARLLRELALYIIDRRH